MKIGRVIDITGQNFGRLKVIGLSHIVRPKTGTSRAFWNCVCKCGSSVVMRGDGLKSGHAKSCGCQKIESAKSQLIDLTGKRFGRLVVIEKAHRRTNGTGFHWKCLCDCGSIAFPASQGLKSGRTKSCGCYHSDKLKSIRGESHHAWKGGTWSRELYDKSWNEELKEFIRNRDNRQCQYPDCDCSDIGKSSRLHVHHINRDKKNCNTYNLISLCNSHHATIEDDDRWIEYFYLITRDYENNYSG